MNTQSDSTKIAELLAVCDAVPDGPWQVEEGIERDVWGVVTQFFPVSPGITTALGKREVAEFIVAAREHMRPLLERELERRQLEEQVQRLTDLVRHQRGELHDAGLITDAEYAELVQVGSESARRLETYDELRAEVERLRQDVPRIPILEKENASLRNDILSFQMER